MKYLSLLTLPLLRAAACTESEPEVDRNPPPVYPPGNPVGPYFVTHNWLSCGAEMCPIAVGGAINLEIELNFWSAVEPVIEGPFRLTSLPSPSPTRFQFHLLHADVVGTGSVELFAGDPLEHGWQKTKLSSLPVAEVRLRPANEAYAKQKFVTDRIAYHAKETVAVVELVPAGAGVIAPPFVMDASVAIAEGTPPRVTEEVLGRLHVGSAPGTFNVLVKGDSFGTRSFEVTVVDHIDQLVARVAQEPTGVGQYGVVCFDAFTDGYEVALPHWGYKFTLEHAFEEIDHEHGDNCVRAQIHSPGTARFAVEVFGMTTQAEFVIPTST